MTDYIYFDDSVNALALSATQKNAIYYVDGDTANGHAVRERCPDAELYGLTVFGQIGPHVAGCDCEWHDMSVQQTVAWVERQVELGVPLIIVYSGFPFWVEEGLLDALAHYGPRIKRWLADYDGDGTNTVAYWEGREYVFDAVQYAGDVPGENGGAVDKNIALANFFTPYKAAPVTHPDPEPSGYVHFTGSVRLGLNEWAVHQLPSIRAHYGERPRKWDALATLITRGAPNSHEWRIRHIKDGEHVPTAMGHIDIQAHGKAEFAGTINLQTAEFTIHWLPGTAHYGNHPNEWAAQILLQTDQHGRPSLRAYPIPQDSLPLHGVL